MFCLRGNGEWDRDVAVNAADGDGDRAKSTTLWSILLTALDEWEFTWANPTKKKIKNIFINSNRIKKNMNGGTSWRWMI